ncbi:hypothetical protein [Aestuariivirga sp.]|uniref:hypothetical protein n=1 Tax=Aestuariivirga sp. TaxID=2650926 RepID=UPI00391B7EE3
MSRPVTATATSASNWTSFETAMRLTLRSLSAPSSDPSAFEAIEGEQARIRRSGRHWLLG